MHEFAERLAGSVLSVGEDLDREFDARLADCSTLAFRVAYGVLRHHQDAEDIAQEALVRAYRSFRQLRDRDRFRAWLVRITWRLAIDRRRGDRRREAREHDEALDRATATPPQDLEARERADHLWRAIDTLPEKLRMVVILAGIEEHNLREVARLLAVPEGTAKSRMFEARQRLKEQLQWTRADPHAR